MNKNVIGYFVVLVFALVFLYLGYSIANAGGHFRNEGGVLFVEARITGILDVREFTTPTENWESISFEATITRGARAGEVVSFTQNVRGYFLERFPRAAREGDRVVLSFSEITGTWNFVEYVRLHYVMALGLVFVVLLIIFGRVKGLNAVLSLGLTGTAVFAVFIPSIMSGRNIYIASILVCLYTIVVTIFLVNGFTKKSFSAVVGCLGGVVAAGGITVLMGRVMELTGVTQTESLQLLYLAEAPLDLNAIIFAGIVIGASGAIMDMAVSISSAMLQVKIQSPALQFGEIFKAGVSIGKDIIGSNINTLVLAYIGSSLTMILILLSHSQALFRVLNRELVVVEILQAIVGSFGVFLTMPLTAVVCATLFSLRKERDYANSDDDFWKTGQF